MMTQITPALRLQCKQCGYRPPAHSTLEEFDLHARLEHADTYNPDIVAVDLIAVCTCGNQMTHVETRGDGYDFIDHYICLNDFNRGVIHREKKPA